jgi:hypothetical protein
MGKPNLTWEESKKRDLKDLSITKELAMDRVAQNHAIHVPKPLVGCEILWVSPLTYPNFYGSINILPRQAPGPQEVNEGGHEAHLSTGGAGP